MGKIKKFAEYVVNSVKFLINPKSWARSFGIIRDYFPSLQTIIYDDIDIKKIVSFVSKTRSEEKVYKVITTIALINGAIALVPGQMGPAGITICRGLEFYMAFEIAKTVGLKVEWKNFYKVVIATGVMVLSVYWLMVSFIGFFASFVFFAPAVILATDFLGLFFWLSFGELHKFQDIKQLSNWTALRIGAKALKLTYGLSVAQIKVIGKFGSKLKDTGKKIWYLINFKQNNEKIIKGDLFFAIAAARLLENQSDSLKGPFGQMWLESWRKSFTQKLGPEATFEDISKFAQSHNTEQMPGVLRLVRSKFFEVVETQHENADGDTWVSELADKPNEPIVDAKMINTETGRTYQIQYKHTENKYYVERTLQDHPDVQIIVPKGVAEKINHPMVVDGNYSPEDLNKYNENFEDLLNQHHAEFLALGGLAAGTMVLAANLLPFIYAYHKKAISKQQFEKAIKKFVPDITARTIHRVTLLSILNVWYAFFLIAKFVGKIALEGIDEEDDEKQTKENIMKKKYSRREFFLFFAPKIV